MLYNVFLIVACVLCSQVNRAESQPPTNVSVTHQPVQLSEGSSSSGSSSMSEIVPSNKPEDIIRRLQLYRQKLIISMFRREELKKNYDYGTSYIVKGIHPNIPLGPKKQYYAALHTKYG